MALARMAVAVAQAVVSTGSASTYLSALLGMLSSPGLHAYMLAALASLWPRRVACACRAVAPGVWWCDVYE